MKDSIRQYNYLFYGFAFFFAYEILFGAVRLGLGFSTKLLLLGAIYFIVDAIWLVGMALIWEKLSSHRAHREKFTSTLWIFFGLNIPLSLICSFIEVTMEKAFILNTRFDAHFYDNMVLYFPYLLSVVISSFMLNVLMIGKEWFKDFKERIAENEKLSKQHAIAQFEVLQNRVNPQFLFASLNTLHDLLPRDIQRSHSFVQHLSRVYRYILENRESELVDLGTELEFLKSYAFLLAVRFDNAVTMDVDILPQSYEKRFLPLSSQIIIDNFLATNDHVLQGKPVSIEIKSDEQYLTLIDKTPHGGPSARILPGLASIVRRYQFLSALPVITNQHDQYFEVRIPLIQAV